MSAATGGGGARVSTREPLSAATRRRLHVVNVCVGVVPGAGGVLMLVLSSSLSLLVAALGVDRWHEGQRPAHVSQR